MEHLVKSNSLLSILIDPPPSLSSILNGDGNGIPSSKRLFLDVLIINSSWKEGVIISIPFLRYLLVNKIKSWSGDTAGKYSSYSVEIPVITLGS